MTAPEKPKPRLRPTHIITRPDGSQFEVNATEEAYIRWRKAGVDIRPIGDSKVRTS